MAERIGWNLKFMVLLCGTFDWAGQIGLTCVYVNGRRCVVVRVCGRRGRR